MSRQKDKRTKKTKRQKNKKTKRQNDKKTKRQEDERDKITKKHSKGKKDKKSKKTKQQKYKKSAEYCDVRAVLHSCDVLTNLFKFMSALFPFYQQKKTYYQR